MTDWQIRQSQQRERASITYTRQGDTLVCERDGETQTLDLSGEWVVLAPDESGRLDSWGVLKSASRDGDTLHLTLYVPFTSGRSATRKAKREVYELADGETLIFPLPEEQDADSE